MSLSARSSPLLLAIEGKLTGDGLASLCAGEDMTLMLARALVEGAQIDGAESVWRSMNEKRVDPVSLPPQAENVFYVTAQEPVLGGARRTFVEFSGGRVWLGCFGMTKGRGKPTAYWVHSDLGRTQPQNKLATI